MGWYVMGTLKAYSKFVEDLKITSSWRYYNIYIYIYI